MVNLVKKYLNQNGYANQQQDFEETYLSHPDYPSLLSITDSLNVLQIDNVVVKIPMEQFVELPGHFLTFYQDEFGLIKKTNSYVQIESENGKKRKVNFNDFLSKWNALVIAIEPNVAIIKPSKFSSFWYSFFLLCIAFFLSSVYYNRPTVPSLLLLASSLTGVVLSFIISQKAEIVGPLFSKIFRLGKDFNDQEVVGASTGMISNWQHFFEVCLLFFGTNTIALLISPMEFSKTLFLLSVLALPVLLFSIGFQKVKLKKRCVVLCLLVLPLVIVQIMVSSITIPSNPFTLKSGFIYLVMGAILFLVWHNLKRLVTALASLKSENAALKRIKRDYNVFSALSKEVPFLEGLDKLTGIKFGNQTTSFKLSLFLSPSCGQCRTVFAEALYLLERFPEHCSFEVFFNLNPDNTNNPFKIIIECLLTINAYDSAKAREALMEWYINKEALELWKQKWMVNALDLKINDEIDKQYQWCLTNDFNYTPVKILNQEVYPQEYELRELKYFLNEFVDEAKSHIK